MGNSIQKIALFAFLLSIIITALVLACTLNFTEEIVNNGWGAFNVIFNMITVISIIMLNRYASDQHFADILGKN